jgi:hypothetical protein
VEDWIGLPGPGVAPFAHGLNETMSNFIDGITPTVPSASVPGGTVASAPCANIAGAPSNTTIAVVRIHRAVIVGSLRLRMICPVLRRDLISVDDAGPTYLASDPYKGTPPRVPAASSYPSPHTHQAQPVEMRCPPSSHELGARQANMPGTESSETEAISSSDGCSRGSSIV